MNKQNTDRKKSTKRIKKVKTDKLVSRRESIGAINEVNDREPSPKISKSQKRRDKAGATDIINRLTNLTNKLKGSIIGRRK